MAGNTKAATTDAPTTTEAFDVTEGRKRVTFTNEERRVMMDTLTTWKLRVSRGDYEYPSIEAVRGTIGFGLIMENLSDVYDDLYETGVEKGEYEETWAAGKRWALATSLERALGNGELSARNEERATDLARRLRE